MVDLKYSLGPHHVPQGRAFQLPEQLFQPGLIKDQIIIYETKRFKT